jgi:ferric-dicitrate binding protein FerR (iron transport regulator)
VRVWFQLGSQRDYVIGSRGNVAHRSDSMARPRVGKRGPVVQWPLVAIGLLAALCCIATLQAWFHGSWWPLGASSSTVLGTRRSLQLAAPAHTGQHTVPSGSDAVYLLCEDDAGAACQLGM